MNDEQLTAELIVTRPIDDSQVTAPAAAPELFFDDNGTLIEAPAAATSAAEPERDTLLMMAPMSEILTALPSLTRSLPEGTQVHSLTIMNDERQIRVRVFDLTGFCDALVQGQSADLLRFESQAQQYAGEAEQLKADNSTLSAEIASLQTKLQESEDRARSTLEDANAATADLQAKLDQAIADLEAARASKPAESSDGDASKSATTPVKKSTAPK